MRVLVLGASGFIGTHLLAALRARGDDVATASLRDPAAAARAARGCDAIVNLSGESINQRWSSAAKRRIEESRTAAPRAFLDALEASGERPSAYVSASAIGYYGTSETAAFTESSPPGDDFLARVCIAWEREAQRAQTLGMRVAIVRCGVALGTDGGALKAMLGPFRLGAGGVVGNGKQWISWVHVDDAAAIYLRAIDGIGGVVNATAPNPVTNAEFTKTLGEVIERPTMVPVPSFALRAMLGEGADLVVRGQRVIPQRLNDEGYAFAYPSLEPALRSLL